MGGEIQHASTVPGAPKTVPCLINNRTKVFYLIFEMFLVLDK